MPLPTTKIELLEKRNWLIHKINHQTITTQERMDAQQELSAVNAEIKRLNKIQAAEDQRDAMIRRTLGRKEAQANAARADLPERREVQPDEGVLIKAKQLQRELARYPHRESFGRFRPFLAALIEELRGNLSVKERTTTITPAPLPGPLPTDDPQWSETWEAGKPK